jgi:predicted transcriptional regulator
MTLRNTTFHQEHATMKSVRTSDELGAKVQPLADRRNPAPHRVLIKAIEHNVELQEAHESFPQEASTSWRHYKETGLHLTGDEVDAWLKTWGTPQEKEAPDCHV